MLSYLVVAPSWSVVSYVGWVRQSNRLFLLVWVAFVWEPAPFTWSDPFSLPCLDFHFHILFLSVLFWSLRTQVLKHTWHFLTLPFQHLFSVLSVQFLTASHTICQLPLSPRLPAHQSQNVQCLCSSKCSAVSLPLFKIVGAHLLASPGTWWSALGSNYLIWGNYL